MRCPLCPDSVLVVSHRHGIEIDHCPTCRGVWLDRGELDHLVDSIAERLGPRPGLDTPATAPAAAGPAPAEPRYRSSPSPPVERDLERPDDGAWRDDRPGRDRKKRKRRKHAVLDLLEEVLDF